MGVVSAQTATTKPVGYHTETAKGNAFTLMGVNVGNAIAAAGESMRTQLQIMMQILQHF